MASLGRENVHVMVVVSLMEGECSCYGGGLFNQGEWSCYRSGQFNGGRMVMLQQWSLMEGEWLSYGGGQFSGGRMVMLQRLSI